MPSTVDACLINQKNRLPIWPGVVRVNLQIVEEGCQSAVMFGALFGTFHVDQHGCLAH